MAGSEDTALNPSRILEVVLASLRGDGQTEASIGNAYEAIAVIGHASMIATQFRLVGLGEEHNIENNTDATILPKDWNAHANTYSFRRLGNNAVIMGLAGEDKATSFDVLVSEFISSTALPFQIHPDQPDSLRSLFVSPNRLDDLINLFKIHVIQKFAISSLPQQAGDEARDQQRQQQQPEGPPQHDPLREDIGPPPARPYPFDDPLAAAPRQQVPAGDFAPPGFEDEYELNRQSQGRTMPYGGGNFPRSGDRDLYPQGLGPRDPLRGTFGPDLRGGGGMHPTPDDPMFGGFGGQQGGYDPRAPPGSRYDPVGPWDAPPYGRGSGPGGRGFGSGGFGGGFGGGDII
ncbi:conserved hypothetical protein [Talaromyces stipitatus ATCC 10500]|uniref:Uncharacterized protein n=1 Tax=Talaromyces stipitatus (strain ATCC 10500 / CBS 375.48 / QM 6759 / NRRL 1006) TaxID=441959 RepID=B8MRM2_TALSN|nr:uncharacterized protein TSTA_056790 [Talaromyces stipitatus ATCC 10500]EED13179.1 conserved hypothetical protein [Talaromyces stipitatus ATCC 10500]